MDNTTVVIIFAEALAIGVLIGVMLVILMLVILFLKRPKDAKQTVREGDGNHQTEVDGDVKIINVNFITFNSYSSSPPDAIPPHSQTSGGTRG